MVRLLKKACSKEHFLKNTEKTILKTLLTLLSFLLLIVWKNQEKKSEWMKPHYSKIPEVKRLINNGKIEKEIWKDINRELDTFISTIEDSFIQVKNIAQRIKEKLIQEDKKIKIEFLLKHKGNLKNPLLDEDLHFEEGMGNPRFFPERRFADPNFHLPHSEAAPLALVLSKDKGSPNPLGYGSFGAYIKFNFNESAITEFTETLSEKLKSNGQRKKYNYKELANAFLIGRFKNGTPLTLYDKPIPAKPGSPDVVKINNFNYMEYKKVSANQSSLQLQNDSEGKRCPFFSHIRKVNPRLPGYENKRIARRGVFFSDRDQNNLKGLLFLSFQNSLEDQFEYIVNNWMHLPHSEVLDENGNKKNVDSNIDILFCPVKKKGVTSFKFPSIWNDNKKGKPVTMHLEKPLVKFESGIYFFAPAISFFETLIPPKESADFKRGSTISFSKLLPDDESNHKIKFIPETGFRFKK